MALALNNPWRFIWRKTKKPNKSSAYFTCSFYFLSFSNSHTVCLSIYFNSNLIYKGCLKCSQTNQNILFECDQMRSSQHNYPRNSLTPFVLVTVLGSHWSKNLIWSHHINFLSHTCIFQIHKNVYHITHIYIYIYIYIYVVLKNVCGLSAKLRVHWLYYLLRSKTLPPKRNFLAMKQKYFMERWGVWSTFFLSLLPGPLRPGLVVPVMVRSSV